MSVKKSSARRCSIHGEFGLQGDHMSQRFLSARWQNLLMLNYEADPALLQRFVPQGTELDSWNGETFVSLVGFLFLDTKVLGVPIPFHRNFEEINLRFYVRRQSSDGWRRGVVFVREIVPKALIALVARWCYNENYVALPMRSQIQLPDPSNRKPGTVEYSWRQQRSWNSIRAEFDGAPRHPESGSEEAFITEHYWGYVEQKKGPPVEYRVEHPPWRVWRSSAPGLECDVERTYGGHFRATLEKQPRSAFLAEGSAVTVYQGERLATRSC
jgi:uncharacterized protein YqjF (DUF2071 family)